MKKIMIVTPIANEELTVERQIRQIAALNMPGLELIFVMDDYSKDQTRSIIERCGQEFSWLHLEFFPMSTGVVSCYLKGLQTALSRGADYVIEMDGGLSHDPSLIPGFVAHLNAGADCVFGSRFLKGGGFDGLPWYRYAVSRYGTLLANGVLGTRLSDMTSGYEAFTVDVLRRLPLDDFFSVRTTHFYQTEMHYYCHRLNVVEVPIIFHGSSTSLKPKEFLRSLKVLMAVKQREPLKR